MLLPARKPMVGVDLPARYFANPSLFIEDMSAKGIKVRETRPARGGHLLIFAETVGDQGKILEIERSDSGYYRRPISAADRDKDSKKSTVVTGVMPIVSEENVRRSIQENQGLNVTGTRLINKASGNSIHKVKVTFDLEEDKSKVDIRKRVMIGNTSCMIEEYKKKTRTMQCYKCQRYGHSQLQCYASERCGRCAGTHSRRDCNSRTSKCANCSGDHMSTDDRCPRVTNFRDRINNKKVGQVNRGMDEVRRWGPEKERHISRPAPQRPQKEVSIDSNFSKKNLTRLSVSLSTQMLRILMNQESGKLRLEHVPSTINDAVNWANFIEDMPAKGIKVRETRPARWGHLLIFAETVGDQGKILEIERSDSGYYRRPISAADKDKDSKKSIVVTGVMPIVSEENVRRSIQENQGLNVTATRLINKASGNSIHKVTTSPRLTWGRELWSATPHVWSRNTRRRNEPCNVISANAMDTVNYSVTPLSDAADVLAPTAGETATHVPASVLTAQETTCQQMTAVPGLPTLETG